MDDRGRVECPVCGRWLLRTATGRMRAHKSRMGERLNCDGWGRWPRELEENQQ